MRLERFVPPNKGVYKNLPPCSECGRVMVTRAAWQNGVRPEGSAPHHTRGRCTTCWRRERRRSRSLSRRPIRGFHAHLLDDWVELRAQQTPLDDAAERLGMSRAGLDAMLYRARRRGDDRGRVRCDDRIAEVRTYTETERCLAAFEEWEALAGSMSLLDFCRERDLTPQTMGRVVAAYGTAE